jgi:hypothetical protein
MAASWRLAWCLDDRPVSGRHVWEEDTLAQRNMTVVDLQPDEWEHLPIRIGSRHRREAAFHVLELIRPREEPDLEVRLTHRDPARVKALFRSAERLRAAALRRRRRSKLRDPGTVMLGRGSILLQAAAGSWLAFDKRRRLPVPGAPEAWGASRRRAGWRAGDRVRAGAARRVAHRPRRRETLGFQLCLRSRQAGSPAAGSTSCNATRSDARSLAACPSPSGPVIRRNRADDAPRPLFRPRQHAGARPDRRQGPRSRMRSPRSRRCGSAATASGCCRTSRPGTTIAQ